MPRRPLRAGRVDLSIVEPLAFLVIAQQIVSAGDFLELLFGCLVARVEVRMELLRQLAICLLDIGSGIRRGNAENLVRTSHDLLRKNFSSREIMRAQIPGICNTVRPRSVLPRKPETSCKGNGGVLLSLSRSSRRRLAALLATNVE